MQVDMHECDMRVSGISSMCKNFGIQSRSFVLRNQFACKRMSMHVTHMGTAYSHCICCDVRQPLEKVNQMDSTARSKEKAHGKVKLEPYYVRLKKVLIMPNEGGVPMKDVKRQQGKRVSIVAEVGLQVVWVVAILTGLLSYKTGEHHGWLPSCLDGWGTMMHGDLQHYRNSVKVQMVKTMLVTFSCAIYIMGIPEHFTGRVND
eukprot:Gb_35985 [translate_table: standard]